MGETIKVYKCKTNFLRYMIFVPSFWNTLSLNSWCRTGNHIDAMVAYTFITRPAVLGASACGQKIAHQLAW